MKSSIKCPIITIGLCIILVFLSVNITAIPALAVCSAGKHSGGTATCKNKAICDVCGTAYGEVDPDNHTVTETRNYKAPTCGGEGYTGDIYCSMCNILIETGRDIVPTFEHVFTQWELTKRATAEENGERTSVCDICGVGVIERFEITDEIAIEYTQSEKREKNIKFWITLINVGIIYAAVIALYNKRTVK